VNLSSSAFSTGYYSSNFMSQGMIDGEWDISAECKEQFGDTDCSGATAGFAWTPAVWVFLEQAGSYRAHFEMSCTGQDNGQVNYVAGAGFQMLRWSNGVGDPTPFPNGFDPMKFINGVNPFNLPPLPPSPPPGLMQVRCDATNPIVIDQEFDLIAPAMPGDRDIVVLLATVLSTASAPYVDFDMPEEPGAGMYSGSGTFDGSISITKVVD
jgi:hypothetical protein